MHFFPSPGEYSFCSIFAYPSFWSNNPPSRVIQACEEAAKAEGFTRLELVATLPGEPLYAAMGYEVTERMNILMSDGITLPAAHMKK
jgi:hypothetical protein